MSLSRGSDATHEIVLLRFARRANRESVQHSERECVLDRLVLTVTQVALRKYFHSDNALPCRVHLAQNADHRVRVSIHMSAGWIDARKIDFHPRRLRCRPQRSNAVAGTSVRSNNSP